ncbi:NADP-dependent oxidoreductase domain-containing protein [Umbelopsis sp. PMI_123]|nr:NADP-dependent oxidoreductase domain-containing protein [Umbelopsis sp. PMI_123]
MAATLPKMKYTNLGTTGCRVSRICLGTMSFGDTRWGPFVIDEKESLPLIKKAYDAGINFFDTADVYSHGVSELILGKAIKHYNLPRGKIVVATKVFFLCAEDNVTIESYGKDQDWIEQEAGYVNGNGLSRKHIFDSVDASLRRLQLDYIDLLQIHRFDPNTPVEETMEALNDLVRMGKVRYIGASSMWAWQFAKMNAVAEKNGWTKFVTMQNHYNLLHREEEREMHPYCIDAKIKTLPWSPLAGGMLVGKNRDTGRAKLGAGYTEEDSAITDRVAELAEKKGVPAAQLALAWVLSKDVVSSPVIGPRKEHHLLDAIQALAVEITDEDAKYLEEPYKPRTPVGHV